ncbi:VOC family protein [Actinocorallia sp. A-T 12471]|uniref:VOC family protein n=1 Tax=Actinocorallia sp. A-T 12471 TaxID=3089813 RepID=UPI0029D13938|nr:VOC family protein [Actinocorallia sp. A-T 12471]MDX6744948.1 VOC family protein [Actinocorallia sp. A-T 12471]
MTLSMEAVTVDSTEPGSLARWWADALDGKIIADYGFYLAVAGAGAVLGFQRVGEPTPGKNRVHLDFKAADRLAEVARLRGLGASEVGEHEVPGMVWTVLADPEGNQFCVSQELPAD